MFDRSRGSSAAVLVCGVLLVASLAAVPREDLEDLIRFGAEMARKGNWREARFRWERAASLDPNDARVLNNLAVAHEVLGDHSGARDLYTKALGLSGGDPILAENFARFQHFEALSGGRDGRQDSAPTPPAEARGRHERKGSKTIKVPVKLPLPARIDLSGKKTLLVASFLTENSDLLDTNREIVRFLRGEFRKRTALEVLDVTPPPAVPEQSLEDLAANVEFWRHLGKEHNADVIVSGAVQFGKRDASGFQDVDLVSPITGQKVRQTRFVEQEQFTYQMEVLFLDGATGGLLFQDHLRRGAVYGGLSNDPITAFYELVGGLAGDVLAVVSPRTVEELRVIFQK